MCRERSFSAPVNPALARSDWNDASVPLPELTRAGTSLLLPHEHTAYVATTLQEEMTVMFGRRSVWLALALVIHVIAIHSVSGQAAQEAPLSNADIIKLSKLKLGDDVIIAKIKQSKKVALDVTTDGLVQLKQAGVSGEVLAAMLERTTPKQSTPAPISAGGAATGNVDLQHEVRLISGDEEVSLPSNRGDLSVTGMWPVVFVYLDYPGRYARTRIQNGRPTLIVRSPHDPTGYYYLARLDINDEEDNNRSLKIEQKASGFTSTTRVVPAGRWHVEYDASETEQGVWHITPRRDLGPGEYGVVVPGGVLFEFGID